MQFSNWASFIYACKRQVKKYFGRNANKSVATSPEIYLCWAYAMAYEVNMSSNCRYANGNLRRKNRARLKAQGGECGICHGKFGPIHYNEPSDYKHPFSFVIDEIKPVSRYAEFGYSSPREAAEDFNNLQAAHYCCNAFKSNKTNFIIGHNKNGEKQINISDGDW